MIRSYLAGDYGFIRHGLSEVPTDSKDLVFTNRDHNWLTRIQSFPRGTVALFGYGHLIGRNGLLARARDAGYRIRPLTLQEIDCEIELLRQAQ